MHDAGQQFRSRPERRVTAPCRPIVGLGVAVVALIVILPLLSGCHRPQGVPAELLGTWQTNSDPRYIHTSFEITETRITFRRAPDYVSKNTILYVDEQLADEKRAYDIHYRDFSGGEITLSIYYFPGPDGGAIRFKYQKNIVWERARVRQPGLAPLAACLSSRNWLPCSPFSCRGVAQPGSALRSGRRSRGFESHHPDQFSPEGLRLARQFSVQPLQRNRLSQSRFCAWGPTRQLDRCRLVSLKRVPFV